MLSSAAWASGMLVYKGSFRTNETIYKDFRDCVVVDYRFLFWCLGLLALREWKLMKVGDLVQCDYGIGIVRAKSLRHDGPLFRIVFSRFPEHPIWVRPWEVKVINESR